MTRVRTTVNAPRAAQVRCPCKRGCRAQGIVLPGSSEVTFLHDVVELPAIWCDSDGKGLPRLRVWGWIERKRGRAYRVIVATRYKMHAWLLYPGSLHEFKREVTKHHDEVAVAEKSPGVAFVRALGGRRATWKAR